MHLRSPIRRSSSCPLAAVAAAALALALVPTVSAASPDRADRLLDARTEVRMAATPRRPATDVRRARARLARELGRQGVVSADPLTGTVRRLQRLDGALTDPSSAPAATAARAFVAQQATALGLSDADARAMTVDAVTTSPSGLRVVRLHQHVAGIPLFDAPIEVALDRAGRVLTLSGTPRADLPAALPAPALTAAEALERVSDDPAPPITKRERDAQRTTRFATGDTSELVLFGARGVRLAWHVTHRADDATWLDAVVDAATGALLYRANLVARASADLYDNYPGAAAGGTPAAHDLDPYLSSTATLTGPYVHAFADVDDDDHADLTEEIDPEIVPSPVTYPPALPANTAGACDAAHPCTWDHTKPASWQVNKAHAVAQAFWYANHFRDHLAAAPIGFSDAEGAFAGVDALELHALDGAATGGSGPDADHRDNASMATPPDGTSPIMEMYLFSNAGSGAFRDVHGGDDAAIVYHEYAHGLTSRLVTTGAGSSALQSVQSSAMGEGWSDWYAMDLLVREGLVPDDPATAGDIDLGRYVDARPHEIRSQATDCPVGSADTAACPATGSAGAGGYTYGDLGRIADRLEPHADGEIWGQTLWDLRRALVADLGSVAGAQTAERLITDGLRLTPPEPSFLDARNAILAADVNATGGANAARIWAAFAARGMGFYAASSDGDDAAVVEDFSAPPAPDAPRGTIAGTVTSGDTGLPIAGATAGVGGLDEGAPAGTPLNTTTGADGRYAIDAVPAGTYPKVRIAAPGYEPRTTPVTVGGGATTPLDAQLERNWAAAPGGGRLVSTTDDDGAPFGCGGAALIDQDLGHGWSAINTTPVAPPSAVIELPVAISVEAFGLDPTNVCGDDAGASTRGYRLETSADGKSWQVAAQGALTAADRRRTARIAPSAGAAGVKFVRLTLLSALDPAADYVDVAELAVYGTPANVLPSGTLTASRSPIEPGTTITLDASSFRDPDSAIARYDWDFDGNGSVDRSTTTPTVENTYRSAGDFTPTVTVHDFRGGSANASTVVDVAAFAKGAPPRPKPKIAIARTGSRSRIRVRVTCVERCRLSGTATVERRVARRAKLRSRTVLRQAPRSIHGTRTVTLRLSKSARAALRRHRVKGLAARVALKAIVPGNGPRASAKRTVRLKV